MFTAKKLIFGLWVDSYDAYHLNLPGIKVVRGTQKNDGGTYTMRIEFPGFFYSRSYSGTYWQLAPRTVAKIKAWRQRRNKEQK